MQCLANCDDVHYYFALFQGSSLVAIIRVYSEQSASIWLRAKHAVKEKVGTKMSRVVVVLLAKVLDGPTEMTDYLTLQCRNCVIGACHRPIYHNDTATGFKNGVRG